MEEILTNEEMAIYMSKIFNSEIFKNAYASISRYEDLANILAKFYISTGDSTLESAEAIIKEYVENSSDKETFFKNHLMPKIYKTVASTLNMNSTLTLADKIKILEYVDKRNNNNQFYTHCFPGALYDEVSTNGLNISRELFREEFNILSECFRTPFKTGELNYCELSAASLSYATMGVPERLIHSIGGLEDSIEGESLHDTFSRSLKENLQFQYDSGIIDEIKQEEMLKAGMKIIDFYCNSKSCIAFFKKDETPNNYTSNIKSLVVNDFNSFSKQIKNTFLDKIFQNEIALLKENPNQEIEIYENAFKKIANLYPESNEYIDLFTDEVLAYRMSSSAIKNYYHEGFSDGYSIKNGILEPEKFAIAEFTSPFEIMSRRQKSSLERHSKSIESIDANFSSKSKQFKTRLTNLDKKINLIKNENISPEEILMIEMPTQLVIISLVNGKQTVVGNPLLEINNKGEVYSMVKGNIENIVINEMASELENNLPSQSKEEIISRYKATDEYDEEYFEAFDAFTWYSKIKYQKMNKAEQEKIKSDILNKKRKFIVFEEDGKTFASPLKEGGITEVYESESIYNQNGTGKYNELIEKALGLSHISIKSIVINALNNGIGIEEVQKADNAEKFKSNEQKLEGVLKDD